MKATRSLLDICGGMPSSFGISRLRGLGFDMERARHPYGRRARPATPCAPLPLKQVVEEDHHLRGLGARGVALGQDLAVGAGEAPDAADYGDVGANTLGHVIAACDPKLPNLATGVEIKRVEVWVTNKSGTTTNSRNIVALADLGEQSRVGNSYWDLRGLTVPDNGA